MTGAEPDDGHLIQVVAIDKTPIRVIGIRTGKGVGLASHVHSRGHYFVDVIVRRPNRQHSL
jgi:hypothetical protein